MKKLLAILLAAVMVIPMFAACKTTPEPVENKTTEPTQPGKETEPTQSGQETEKPGEPPVEPGEQKVVIATNTEGNGDWAYGSFTNSINATDHDVLTLTDDLSTITSNQEGDALVDPTVVKEWKRDEDPETGNVTYTFTINEGLVFNNGDPVTAENFLAWTLFTSHPTGIEMKSTSLAWNGIPGGKEYSTGDVPYFAGLRLLDPYTFSVTNLKVTYNGETVLPYYYELLSFGTQAVNLDYWFGPGWHVKDDGQGAYLANDDPEKAFTADAIGEFFNNARYATSDRVTAGPYNLTNYDKASGEITFEINDKYCGNFEGRKPSIPKLVISIVNEDTYMDSLKTGQVDIYSAIASGVEVNAILDLIDAGELDLNYCQYDRAGYGYFQFVCDIGPTQWTEFRQAVAYLLNRNEFADTFCAGWGGVVHGPYAAAFQMTKDSQDFFNENLNPYDYDPEKAVELLKEIGFVYNGDGTDYEDGSYLLRYKKVTPEEAAHYESFCTEVDGQLYMPAMINWATSGNEVYELLETMLCNTDATKNAGIRFTTQVMTFPEMLNWMYRQDAYGVGGADYSVPKYNMYNLATSFSSAVYDFSYEFSNKPEYLAQGYNVAHIDDPELDQLSMDMVYGVDAGDYDTYLTEWQNFIARWNELLLYVPLYSNILVSVYPKTITNYQEYPYWGATRAILYADWVG